MKKSSREVVIVCQPGARLTDHVQYGALRATVEIAKQLKAHGRDVLLVGLGDKNRGSIDNVEFVSFATDVEVRRFVRSLKGVKCVIGISRGDIVLMADGEKYIIYQHGSHLPVGLDMRTLRLARVPIICVSESSKIEQIRFGFNENQIHVVRNGYDRELFLSSEMENRDVRSLFYAGSIVPYKGVDIALQAFRLIRITYPEATFHLCGKQLTWTRGSESSLPPQWINGEGYLDWNVIEEELPGVKYHGELSQTEVAAMLRRCSLLIMCSRVAEPCPLIVLEAQASGCIPVVPDSGGWPEIVANQVSGYLYSAPPTAEMLQGQIARIWQENGPSLEQRRAARQWVSRFSWDEAGNQFDAILEVSGPLRQRLRPFVVLSACWQSTRSDVVNRVLTGWWWLMKRSQPVRRFLHFQRRRVNQ